MKNVFLLLSVLVLAFSARSQSTIAKLKYEEAEEAFTKNDFSTTLVKLDEAQKILGSVNPKLLYLRIMAQSGVIQQNPNSDYKMLEEARKNCAFYLKEYEFNEALEDKYRDVYKASEALNKYPKTAAEFEELKKGELRKKEAEEAAKTGQEKSKPYIKGLFDRYQFKLGLTVNELRNYNTETRSLLKKKKQCVNDVCLYNSISGIGNPYPEGPSMIYMGNPKQPDLVTSYQYTIASGSDADKVAKVFQDLKNEIIANVDKTMVAQSNISVTIGTDDGYGISLILLDLGKWHAVNISLMDIRR